MSFQGGWDADEKLWLDFDMVQCIHTVHAAVHGFFTPINRGPKVVQEVGMLVFDAMAVGTWAERLKVLKTTENGMWNGLWLNQTWKNGTEQWDF